MDSVQLIKNDDSIQEIWKPAVKNNKTIPNYWVSNLGRVKSPKKFLKIRNEVYEQRGNRQSVTLSIPYDLFKDYSYPRKSDKCKSSSVNFPIHRLVIETFKPIDDYPPIPKQEWDVTPESARKIIRECCLVDHIDDNPFNNNINNLRWVTPKENNSHVKRKNFKPESNGEQVC